MEQVDYFSTALSDKALKKSYRFLNVAIIGLLSVFFALYAFSLLLSQETVLNWSKTSFFQSVIKIVPLDYDRFLRSNNPSIAVRIWFVEFGFLVFATLAILMLSLSVLILIAKDKESTTKLASLPVINKHYIAGLLLVIVIPSLYFSTIQEKVVNGSNLLSLGANDLVLFFFFACAFGVFLGIWTLTFAISAIFARMRIFR